MLRQDDEVDVDAVSRRFHEVVNVSASMLDQWLDSDEARTSGEVPAPDDVMAEHAPGRRVVDVLRTPPDDLTAVDVAFMRRVVVHVEHQLEKEPQEPAARERWRCSLLGWVTTPTPADGQRLAGV